jgi:hypothetical protein
LLDRIVISFAGANSDDRINRGDPDLAVADLARLAVRCDYGGDVLGVHIIDDNVESQLGDELDVVFGLASISVALLICYEPITDLKSRCTVSIASLPGRLRERARARYEEMQGRVPALSPIAKRDSYPLTGTRRAPLN